MKRDTQRNSNEENNLNRKNKNLDDYEFMKALKRKSLSKVDEFLEENNFKNKKEGHEEKYEFMKMLKETTLMTMKH